MIASLTRPKLGNLNIYLFSCVPLGLTIKDGGDYFGTPTKPLVLNYGFMKCWVVLGVVSRELFLDVSIDIKLFFRFLNELSTFIPGGMIGFRFELGELI